MRLAPLPRFITVAMLSISMLVSMSACSLSTTSTTGTTQNTPAPGDNAPDTDSSGSASLDLLNALEVKGKSPKTGYDRVGKFGPAWSDVDRNGCDTRNDILTRDLTDIRLQNGCRVLSGHLTDPYTGTEIDFVRGNKTSSLVQIDHVVALSNAWQTGAQKLTQEERLSLANDPLNLLAVDGPTNSKKGDGDAATWLPPNKSYRCDYVGRQVSVKAAYGLWVTESEKNAMASVLEGCPAN